METINKKRKTVLARKMKTNEIEVRERFVLRRKLGKSRTNHKSAKQRESSNERGMQFQSSKSISCFLEKK